MPRQQSGHKSSRLPASPRKSPRVDLVVDCLLFYRPHRLPTLVLLHVVAPQTEVLRVALMLTRPLRLEVLAVDRKGRGWQAFSHDSGSGAEAAGSLPLSLQAEAHSRSVSAAAASLSQSCCFAATALLVFEVGVGRTRLSALSVRPALRLSVEAAPRVEGDALH